LKKTVISSDGRRVLVKGFDRYYNQFLKHAKCLVDLYGSAQEMHYIRRFHPSRQPKVVSAQMHAENRAADANGKCPGLPEWGKKRGAPPSPLLLFFSAVQGVGNMYHVPDCHAL